MIQILEKFYRIAPFAVILVFTAIMFDMRLKTVFYKIKNVKVKNTIRIALVTDLHSCYYGKEQSVLTDAIDRQKPDAIAMSGDIFDDELKWEKAWNFINGIVKSYPCYYVAGNHELRRKDHEKLFESLSDKGVIVLRGNGSELVSGHSKVWICGVDDPENMGIDEMEEKIKYACADNITDEFAILLAHRPDLINMYRKYKADLVLSGHAHGGQWRIPLILNGTFAPDQGVFPKLAGGFFDFGDCKMIVSRGLARESTLVPRIFNRPELVIVDITPDL